MHKDTFLAHSSAELEKIISIGLNLDYARSILMIKISSYDKIWLQWIEFT